MCYNIGDICVPKKAVRFIPDEALVYFDSIGELCYDRDVFGARRFFANRGI